MSEQTEWDIAKEEAKRSLGDFGLGVIAGLIFGVTIGVYVL